MNANVFETPLQNSVERETGSQLDSSPPSSQDTLSSQPDNSPTSSNPENDEVRFFNDPTYRKLYHKLHKSVHKVEKSTSRIWFLKMCLKFKILPPTLALNSNHNSRFSSQASASFQNNLTRASLDNLKLGLEEEKKHLVTCKKAVRDDKTEIHAKILDPPLHIYIEERILHDKAKLHKCLQSPSRKQSRNF